MSQSKITTFANETLDKIFAYLADKDAWLALIKGKTHRSFKSSAQQLLYRDIQVPAQHTPVHNGRCSMLLTALTAAPHLTRSVQTLQIDCQLEGAYPYGKLSLERDAIREILAKLANLQSLTIFILDDPRSTFEQMDASSEIAQMLRDHTTTPISIDCPEHHLAMSTWLFGLPTAKTLVVRENITHAALGNWTAPSIQWFDTVNFRNLTSIDYKWCTYPSIHNGRAAVKKAGTASQLEKLRFTWYLDGAPTLGLDGSIANLWATQQTLRELTILPGICYEVPQRPWSPTRFTNFTALQILHVPAFAFFEEMSCGSLKANPNRVGFELRSDITTLLPPNVRELEIWFRYPCGIFATGGSKMRQFQELSEPERQKWFGWILALLRLRSLRRVRMSESLCAHDGGGCWKQERGSWPSCKFILPEVVSEAFAKAGVDLEIMVLDRMAVYHGMY